MELAIFGLCVLGGLTISKAVGGAVMRFTVEQIKDAAIVARAAASDLELAGKLTEKEAIHLIELLHKIERKVQA